MLTTQFTKLLKRYQTSFIIRFRKLKINKSRKLCKSWSSSFFIGIKWIRFGSMLV